MVQPCTLVIGANRGIGFEIAKQLSEQGHDIIATYRQSAGGLEGDGAPALSTIGGVDIADPAGVDTLIKGLGDRELDTVVVVSGVLRVGGIEDPGFDDVLLQLVVNSVGPLRAAVALQDRFRKGGKLAILTSRMGSLADNTSGGMYGYRMSKAAVNAVGVSLARDLAPKNVAVALLHPGYVKTEMTGGNGHLEPGESARLLIERLGELSMENTGSFWHANGEDLPW